MPGARDDGQQPAADAGDLFRPNTRNLLDRKQLLAKFRVFQFLRVGLLLLEAGLFTLLVDLRFLVLAAVGGMLDIPLDTLRAVELAVAQADHKPLFRQLIDAPCRQPEQQG
ncbi:MAG: hypothetical protein BGO06_15545 [Shinella sp. 65-6]|nr:MAG: hypothetical protein BGO06_15545 [Shinella sp. 65-6]